MRDPVVSGQFYPSEPEKLKKILSKLIPNSEEKESVKAVILPHAGYIYSGAVAGETLSGIKIPKTVIMLGPNHTGFGVSYSLMPKSSWNTPLGEVPVDEEIADELLSASKHLQADRSAHLYEHSLEVLLPFLQYISNDFRFVPIILADDTPDNLKAIGREIAETIQKRSKDILILVSTDMTHYETQENANKKDKIATDDILRIDPDMLYTDIKKHNITMCGYAPTITALHALKHMGASESRLVKYQTSGDVSGDYSSVVGYAGITIK